MTHEPRLTVALRSLLPTQLQGARQVAGFGAARSLDAETMAEVLRPPR